VFSVIHETGPIITGLVVSGRVGAGIGAELASMKVTEQIDAIEASAVNPYRLLAATRILACILMLPLLTLACRFLRVAHGLGGAGPGRAALVPPVHQQRFQGRRFQRFLPPTFKTCCVWPDHRADRMFSGMRTQGGAAGVGRAATSSVVLSSLFVILADVVLVKFILIFFP
jgi:phospholipid/cholesterol/gamma-HCH transport system permease protein